MRVLVVNGAGAIYGRELITVSIMRGLRDRGHQIGCITSTWGDRRFVGFLNEIPVSHWNLPLGFISKTASWPAMLMTLDQIRKLPQLWLGYRRIIKKFAPDVVVHSNFHHLLILWPVLYGKPNVFHVHDYLAPSKFYRLILQLIARRVCLFIGVSKFIADSLAQLGISRESIRCVLNGIPPENHQAPIPESAPQFTAVGNGSASPQEVCIGVVGQLGEWKGHHDLIEALRLLKQSGTPFICKIFGDGNQLYVDELREKIERYGLTNQIRWMGFVADAGAIYSSIDLCVIPSRAFEAFGMVAAEAAIHGLPTVATRQGALPEIVQDEITGYLINPAMCADLAAKIRLLIDSPAMRRRMGLAASDFARRKLTGIRMVEEIETQLQLMVNRPSKCRT